MNMCVCDCIETVQWEAYLNTRLFITPESIYNKHKAKNT